MKHLSLVLALVLSSALVILDHASAEQSEPHPIVEKPVADYPRLEHLSELNLEQLLKLKSDYLVQIKELNKTVAKTQQNEQQLMRALKAYDKERLRIIEVIPNLIRDYQIKPPFSNTLKRYAQTFEKVHRQYRGKLDTLDDYRSYDFRLGMTYMGMMTALQQQPKLYHRLSADMKDQDTAIGRYVKQLDVAYVEVERASDSIDEIHAIRHLENELKRIEQELLSRR